MKNRFKRSFKNIFLLGIFLLAAVSAHAQDDDLPPTYDEQPPDLPIDDNLIYLGIASVGLGIYAIQRHRKRESVEYHGGDQK